MNKTSTFFLIGLVAVSCLIMSAKSKAQERSSFSGVFPFTAGEDRVGFFDQKTGQVYIYDNNLTRCSFIGQMAELGQPITPVVSNNPVDNSPGNNLNQGADQWNNQTANTTTPSQ